MVKITFCRKWRWYPCFFLRSPQIGFRYPFGSLGRDLPHDMSWIKICHTIHALLHKYHTTIWEPFLWLLLFQLRWQQSCLLGWSSPYLKVVSFPMSTFLSIMSMFFTQETSSLVFFLDLLKLLEGFLLFDFVGGSVFFTVLALEVLQ